MNRILLVLTAVVFLQTLCVGANFTSLQFFSEELGRTGIWIGLLWFGLTVPRAILSPFWGSLSDRIGRKPLMIIGAAGVTMGSLLWAIAGSYEVLLLSRVVESALSAGATISFAIIADTLAPKKRAAAMGMLGAAVMLSFTLGPIMGAVVGEMAGYRALGLVMAGLQFLSLVLVLFLMPETRTADPRTSRELRAMGEPMLPIFARVTWRRAFSHPNTAALLVVSLVLTSGYTVFNAALPYAAMVWYDWGAREIAWAFVVLGLTAGIAQGGLVRPLVPRLGERRVILIGLVLMAMGLAGLGLAPNGAATLVLTGVLAIGGGISIPSLAGLLSSGIGGDDQGLVLGLNQSAQGIGRGVGPLAGSLVMVQYPAAPFAMGALMIVLAGVVLTTKVKRLG